MCSAPYSSPEARRCRVLHGCGVEPSQPHYCPVGQTRWVCRSYTTRIAEVENAGSREERVLQPDTGYGFLWRLYSFLAELKSVRGWN